MRFERRLAAEELQQRVGRSELSRCDLPWSEQILNGIEEQQQRPAPIYRASLVLGGQTFDLTLADEHSKANVNIMLAGMTDPTGGERSRAEDRVRQMLAGSGLGNRVRLHLPAAPAPRQHPSTAPASRPGEPPVYWPIADEWVTGLGQIFDGVSPRQLLASPGGLAGPPGASELLTCWGGGAINVRRAPAEAMQAVAGSGLTRLDVDRLIHARNQSFLRVTSGPRAGEPGAAPGLESELERLGRQLAVAQLRNPTGGDIALVATSACHSLWIVVRRQTPTVVLSDRTGSDR